MNKNYYLHKIVSNAVKVQLLKNNKSKILNKAKLIT